jgi:hypothetical protein
MFTELMRLSSNEQNAADCPFLNLPAELRNIIYSYALTKDTQVLVVKTSRKNNLGPNKTLSLLSVCRKIHTETALLPFTLNTLRFVNIRDLPAGIDMLKANQRAVVKNIHIDSQVYKTYLHPGTTIVTKMEDAGTHITDLFPILEPVVGKNMHYCNCMSCIFEQRPMYMEDSVMEVHEWLSGGPDGKVKVVWVDTYLKPE